MYTGKNSRRKRSGRPETAAELVIDMMRFINNTDDGFTTIGHLHEAFSWRPSHELWSLLLSNPKHFHIQEQDCHKRGRDLKGNERIWIKTDLCLCENHCRKSHECSGSCGRLHLCQTFLLLGAQACPFSRYGKSCHFGHSFKVRQNSYLLSEHNLSSFNENELRQLFQRRICRSESTMPQICIYYNGKGQRGCVNKRCRSLHLCLNYVKGVCHQGLSCPNKYNHSLQTKQVTNVLSMYAIDKTWPDEAIFEDLRRVMNRRIRKDSENSTYACSNIDSCSEEESDFSDGEIKSDSDDLTELKKPFVPLVVDEASGCCSHCTDMREAMSKMSKKIEDIEKRLSKLLQTGKSLAGQDEDKDQDMEKE